MSLCWEALWGVSNNLILQIFQKDNGKINLSGLAVTITLHTHTHQFLAKIMQEVYSLSFHIGRNSDKGHSQGYAQLRHMRRKGEVLSTCFTQRHVVVVRNGMVP